MFCTRSGNDLVFKEVTTDYKNGNALVVDLVFKEVTTDYKNGNALVVRTRTLY
jgi:hypothetical protein